MGQWRDKGVWCAAEPDRASDVTQLSEQQETELQSKIRDKEQAAVSLLNRLQDNEQQGRCSIACVCICICICTCICVGVGDARCSRRLSCCAVSRQGCAASDEAARERQVAARDAGDD
eukprot:3301974-Rhodomonas_salina.1